MRTLICLIVSSFVGLHSITATVRTVSNHPAGGAENTTLRAAYDASSSGDTLLVEGTDIPYHLGYECHIHWANNLTVIGIGFNPNKQAPKRTKFQNTHCGSADHFHIASSGGGSHFYGIEFLNHVLVYQTSNNLQFSECKFNINIGFSQGASNLAFTNCIFDTDNSPNINFAGTDYSVNALISNCIFDGHIQANGGVYNTASIEHCLFLSTTTAPFYNLYYAQIRDNVFMNVFPSGTHHSDYQNNLAAVAGTFPPSPENGNTGSGLCSML
jgi:hypothetical protein